MTLYVILGEGQMPAKEVAHQLNDLWKQCEDNDTDFWFAMEGKPEASATDRSIVAFFSKYGIHYGLFNVEGISPSDDFMDVAEYFDVDSVPEGVLSLMESVKGDGEEAVLLALFTDDEDRDDSLINTVAMVLKSGFKVLGLNDALEPVELLTEEVKPMPEDTVEPKPKKVVPTVTEDEDEDDTDGPEPLTREYLELLTANEIKEITKGMGITTTNKAENIDAILAAAGTESGPEITAPTLTIVPDIKVETIRVVSDHPSQDQPDEDQPDEEMVLVVIHSKSGMLVKSVPASHVAHL